MSYAFSAGKDQEKQTNNNLVESYKFELLFHPAAEGGTLKREQGGHFAAEFPLTSVSV